MDGIEDLERWAADARARDAADARVRERWLRAQAEEDASLAGALLACAEREESVVLTTVDGRRHRGTVAGVGLDFCAVVAPGGTSTLVALDAVAEVRPADPGDRRRLPAAGAGRDRASLGVRLADVLAQAAGQRPRISVQAGTATVVGDLRTVGSDVLTVRTDGTGGLVYVRLPSVSAVSFLASG
ncbi:MAG: hypothetical protein M3066_15590 [Actinomycetota bacterium]|nr:hypothetical protein [Actinomycetota bacterium]